MFTHNSSVGKTRVWVSQRTPVGVLVLVLGLLMGALSLAGCKDDSGDTGNLVGNWTSADDDGYIITATTVTYTSSTDVSFGYTGEIKNAPDFTQPYGVIIIEYTTPPTYYDFGPAPDYEKKNPHPPAGNFQGIYWKDLTATSVELANAYKSPEPEEATLAAAETAFTLENVPTYVYAYSSCSKN